MYSNVHGGNSITPHAHTSDGFDVTSTLDKESFIDWVSYTFSDVIYDYEKNKNVDDYDHWIKPCKHNDYILNSLIRILSGKSKPWKSFDIIPRAINGYKFSWHIGEFIEINFCGPKMKNKLESTQILLRGKACREFENDYDGSWIELFEFLRGEHQKLGFKSDENGEPISGYRFNGSFKRFDITLDDYTGDECNIYDLEEPARNYWWTGPYRTVDIQHPTKKEKGKVISKGFAITFGVRGSNQFQQYDKLLEMKAKDENWDKSNVWFRHEMRFVDPKADAVVDMYLTYAKTGFLGNFIYELLMKQMKYKIYTPSDSNIARWHIRPDWNKLLKYSKELPLIVRQRPERSIERKFKWFEYSMETTMTEFYLSVDRDPVKFMELIMQYVKNGVFRMNDRHFSAVNKYLKDKGLPEIPEKEVNKLKMRGFENEKKE